MSIEFTALINLVSLSSNLVATLALGNFEIWLDCACDLN